MTIFAFYGSYQNDDSMITHQQLNYFFENNASLICQNPRPEGYTPPVENDTQDQDQSDQGDQSDSTPEIGIINPLTEIFLMFDVNQDGIISANDIRLAFAGLDLDQSGFLYKDEIMTAKIQSNLQKLCYQAAIIELSGWNTPIPNGRYTVRRRTSTPT